MPVGAEGGPAAVRAGLRIPCDMGSAGSAPSSQMRKLRLRESARCHGDGEVRLERRSGRDHGDKVQRQLGCGPARGSEAEHLAPQLDP